MIRELNSLSSLTRRRSVHIQVAGRIVPEAIVRRTDARHLSLFHRLGIILLILGMVQALMPTWCRPARSALRASKPLRIALINLDDDETSTRLTLSEPTLPTEPTPDQEQDQDSTDTEDLAESFAWIEALTDRRSIQGSTSPAPLAPFFKPDRAEERTLSTLQLERSLPILAASSACVTARLCRFIC
jgi:hypothetical protein